MNLSREADLFEVVDLSSRRGYRNRYPTEKMNAVLKLIASATIITLIGAAAFCWAYGIRSTRDLQNYREMIACQHPVVESLAEGIVFDGMLERDLLLLHKPEWTETYGCYSSFGFTPQGSYDYVTISTMNNRVCSAHAGSCTWRWTYFANTPSDVLETVHAIEALTRMIDQSPNTENVLRPILKSEYAKLGVHP